MDGLETNNEVGSLAQSRSDEASPWIARLIQRLHLRWSNAPSIDASLASRAGLGSAADRQRDGRLR